MKSDEVSFVPKRAGLVSKGNKNQEIWKFFRFAYDC